MLVHQLFRDLFEEYVKSQPLVAVHKKQEDSA